MNKTNLISLHGGHSGQYCNHARDLLEDIIQRYIELGFTTVGITEHIPPLNDIFLYPDEKALHLTTADLYQQFEAYFNHLTALKKKYKQKINIFVGMETETYTGYADHIKELILTFQPDYIVGSVHHVNDICFDYSKEDYEKIVSMCGSHDAMYEKYFDLQYDMIKTLKPFVVGHFDLIRIYDKDYKKRILMPAVDKKIKRNLKLIKSLNLVLDFNLRPLAKGKKEPYITESILKTAKKMGIRLVPGDDSHGVNEAGLHVDMAIHRLKKMGFDTKWPDPVLVT
ncbi:histidinol-phosphatase HisJ [Desulfobacula phenolica]|uniref:Histidinol-phosphatase n=1 Tax=Desulfobacula phenolica TaxID=90732 RepID=A0A1H2DLW6_9BACT|nr:histidinol-phosphatase HisJ [Desulfobacula phenolica]SDT83900.1 histidinol-phosphatase (PHP family) [Desulfobacula phenolica]